jgi:ketosteroid isomerase-like protein
MPSRERLQAFIKTVEAGEFVRAIEDFYADEASMRENLKALRKTRAAFVAHEQAMLGRGATIKTRPVERMVVDDDLVVINWVFDITERNGKRYVLDELAVQRWRDDKIVEEQFYYDPAFPTTANRECRK